MKAVDSYVAIPEQRKNWQREFLKTFAVVFVAYAVMYLVRTNLKAAQPLLASEYGITNTQLGVIGAAFSITYGIGKFVLGFVVDGRNTKKIISVLLGVSGGVSLLIGLLLLVNYSNVSVLVILWGLNGVVQSPGAPSAFSTISRWTTADRRGTWLGLWNASHNIGGAFAGIFALWGANLFFGGHVSGMFLVPAIVAIVMAIFGYVFGRDDPRELGWNSPDITWEVPESKDNESSQELSKRQVFVNYVLNNPWIWILCVTNIFIYIVRIGVDNWAPLYTVQVLNMSTKAAANTIFYFELGAFLGSLSWGYLSDLMKGRRAVLCVICLFFEYFSLIFYQNATTEMSLYASLFILGWLLFGPQLLLGVSLVGFVPTRAAAVTNGIAGTFAYLFGDFAAKIGLGMITDPKSSGLTLFGQTLHGWSVTFSIFKVMIVLSVICFIIVSFGEEKRIKERALLKKQIHENE